jgi:hypothetical protein
MGNAYAVSLGKRHGKRPGVYLTMIFTWILRTKQWKGMDWIHTRQNRDQQIYLVYMVMHL